MKRMAEVKDSLDIDVKQNFIDPLQGLCDKDLREIQVCNAHVFISSPSSEFFKLSSFNICKTLSSHSSV